MRPRRARRQLRAAESRAPGDSAAGAGDTPAANAAAADAKADDFDRTPKDCVTPSNIRQTAVIDDSTILFYMRGGNKPTYRTALPHDVPQPRSRRPLLLQDDDESLCDIDLITVLEQFGAGLRDGFTCRLGPFYPIPYEEAELLRKEHDTPHSTRGGIKTKPAEVAAEERSAARRDRAEPSRRLERASCAERIRRRAELAVTASRTAAGRRST